ncbi:transmembrane protein 180 [Trypanosoma theileri]|uniref:Transmembrane protein 180 n=1 Tax=Trypanosoma theileri TaxID=67003 RepID=A0A1X0NZT8_9TRYP|nr:transmembrane protein 180 [Trypanosoma theileri]ORC90068.1 transmembrane protein 180 [Trypanosoma theileri]
MESEVVMRLKHISAALMGLLHAMFTSYYTDLFVRQYILVTESRDSLSDGENNNNNNNNYYSKGILLYFLISQILYALWNITKVFVFTSTTRKLCASFISRVQLWRLSRCGPIWTIVFALLWFPINVQSSLLFFFLNPAIQYTLMIAIYDILFSYCKTALLTPFLRESETYYSDMRAYDILGGVGVSIACYLREMEGGELYAFRWFTTISAVIAGLSLYICGLKEHNQQKCLERTEGMTDNSNELLRFTQQTMNRPSMKAAFLLWGVQGYMDTFTMCFFCLFLDMCRGSVSLPVRSLLLFLVFVAPYTVFVATAPFYSTVGKKRIVSVCLIVRVLLGALLLALALHGLAFFPSMNSKSSTTLFVIFLFSNRTLTGAVRYIQNLIFRDLVDEDIVIFARPYQTTSATHQVLEIASKPSRSLAILLTSLFIRYIHSHENTSVLDYIAGFAAVTTLVTSLLALWVWQRYYSIDGSHLQFIRMGVRKRGDEDV